MEVACLDPIADLRRRIAALDAPARGGGAVAFGIEEVDGRLADGGLATGGLHEVAAAAPTLAEDAATTLFLAGIAARALPSAPVLWALTRFDLYAPGLEQAGLVPDRLVLAQARDERELLAVMEDALRHGGLSAVVGDVRRIDMTASRRLQLAAADGRTPALLLRRWRKLGTCPLAEPSAATTRWRIGCAPSAPLGIPGVGRARWTVELVRQRNGNPFTLTLEGCDAQGRLGLPAPFADRAAGAGHHARAA
ncbi:protein ImuA [Sphingomonas sp. 3P27F8]|uniref:ImuA family protein n=1 Tax=Sphingomonas sp. 3P27F8 TaxID=2502213 RepID=UPI0020166ECC|nr:protein ImuA [Sphingomonas sp. 3P27F8]